MDFWHQHACRNYYAIEEEGDPVSDDLSDEEECIHDMEFLPHRHFLVKANKDNFIQITLLPVRKLKTPLII